ncbi:glycosyltransferase family 2 protein [Falsirhodobacter sp. 20TX0035]|uniref:glycosyltransferase family 2 protein n=1 Tax=Falsirhodobacter sp. 20TX0035 TaxID=3022019 RepID=UPI00232FA917|nr:glycosyltransferase family 2 protein [Falsirhodobacter sp. 20TX0035]MDB6452699.1 glycosyltransferase family 2 protein [Falsirhodobacter sp. 20TX0035]
MDEGPLTVPPRVALLLATFNGAAHLQAQLDSLAAQTMPPTWLIVGDDGSTDDTRRILQRFADAHPSIDLRLIEGPRKGAALNFLSLLAHVPPGAEAVGFCDQDDVWLPEKTARACAALAGAAGPRMYCAATWVCDVALGRPRLSRTPSCATGFRHALVQNVAGGNTMMLNRAATDLLIRAARGVDALIVHDWWAYQVVSGAGGTVVFDPEPCLWYRQHGRNQIGANDGTRARLRRIAMLLGGHFRGWNAVNLAALGAARPLLTAEAGQVLDRFEALRQAPLSARLRLLRQAGLYRQDLAGNASLWVAAVLGRL